MVKYEIPEVLLQNVLNYLGQRPYVEVYELIAALHRQAKPILPETQDAIPKKQILQEEVLKKEDNL